MKKIFVAEIDGRAVVAFTAEDREAADDWIRGPASIADLCCLETEGAPLLADPDNPEILLREPLPEEEASWRKSRDANEPDAEDWLMYLVPVTDATDDPPDDDGSANYDNVIKLC